MPPEPPHDGCTRSGGLDDGCAAIAVYAIGSAVWVGSGDGFYRALETPPWQPPDAIFGIAWTYNFVMLAVVAIQVARHGTACRWECGRVRWS